MIPRASITAWRRIAPWPENTQVEQDLVLCRALVAMFGHPRVSEQAVFRDVDAAWRRVHERLVGRLPGDPWKGGQHEAQAPQRSLTSTWTWTSDADADANPPRLTLTLTF